jgi:hypothetical protein
MSVTNVISHPIAKNDYIQQKIPLALPQVLLTYIANFFDTATLLECNLTCKSLRQSIESVTVQKHGQRLGYAGKDKTGLKAHIDALSKEIMSSTFSIKPECVYKTTCRLEKLDSKQAFTRLGINQEDIYIKTSARLAGLDCQQTFLNLLKASHARQNECLSNFVTSRSLKLAKVMLIHKANPDFRKKRNTILHIEASQGNVASVQLLIEGKANVNLPGKHENTVLNHICSKRPSGTVKMVECLLKANADPNLRFEDSFHLPLHNAAYHSNIKCVQLLLENRAQVNLSIKGITPLYEACNSHIPRVNIVQLLLKHQANPLVGKSPLQRILTDTDPPVKLVIYKNILKLLSPYYTKEQLSEEFWEARQALIQKIDSLKITLPNEEYSDFGDETSPVPLDF